MYVYQLSRNNMRTVSITVEFKDESGNTTAVAFRDVELLEYSGPQAFMDSLEDAIDAGLGSTISSITRRGTSAA